jgi:hypothetical protein
MLTMSSARRPAMGVSALQKKSGSLLVNQVASGRQ